MIESTWAPIGGLPMPGAHCLAGSVVIARRHLVGLGELNGEEATELGLPLQQASAALGLVIGCPRTYIAAFGEQSGFEHLHVHVVPRMANFDKHHLGGGVFGFLKRPEVEWVSPEARDQLAVALADALSLVNPRETREVDWLGIPRVHGSNSMICQRRGGHEYR